jgi:predicted  nucleic acid-binding Zn-ribbon protein
MNVDLKNLIRLQSIDLSILEIQERINVFPGISKALDDKLGAAVSALDAAREKSKTDTAARKKLEGEVTAFEAKISKYREQMLSVKTNEEYKAFQKEIEHAQEGIRGVEDKILTFMMAAESVQAEIKAAEARLKEDQLLVNQERKALEVEHQKDVTALESYLSERKTIEPIISADLLPRYERVRKFRGGIGVAPAKDYMCDACKVRLRPQVFQEIRKNDQIIACDACQRVLYDPENMDNPFEVV